MLLIFRKMMDFLQTITKWPLDCKKDRSRKRVRKRRSGETRWDAEKGMHTVLPVADRLWLSFNSDIPFTECHPPLPWLLERHRKRCWPAVRIQIIGSVTVSIVTWFDFGIVSTLWFQPSKQFPPEVDNNDCVPLLIITFDFVDCNQYLSLRLL